MGRPRSTLPGTREQDRSRPTCAVNPGHSANSARGQLSIDAQYSLQEGVQWVSAGSSFGHKALTLGLQPGWREMTWQLRPPFLPRLPARDQERGKKGQHLGHLLPGQRSPRTPRRGQGRAPLTPSRQSCGQRQRLGAAPARPACCRGDTASSPCPWGSPERRSLSKWGGEQGHGGAGAGSAGHTAHLRQALQPLGQLCPHSAGDIKCRRTSPLSNQVSLANNLQSITQNTTVLFSLI